MPVLPPVSRRARLGLALILGIGLALRAAYLVTALSSPGYRWDDPDGYAVHAARLITPHGWRWSFDAVTYTLYGQRHALPPLYTVFLSAFAPTASPVRALIAQLALAVIAIALTFALGRRLFGVGAALVAAAGYAVWVPNIFNVWSTSQEALYIPLSLFGFLLLVRAIDENDGATAFAVAGAVFGLAALTRSMPLFFVVPAMLLHVAAAPDRRRSAVQAAAFLAAFAVVTVPYIAALSRYFDQLTVIDTHGAIHFGETRGAATPTLRDTASGLWSAFASHPIDYLLECADRARTVLHVNGGRILQVYVVAGSVTAAAAWKVFVHLGADAILIAGSILAVPGVVLSTRRRLALLLMLWIALNLAVASLGGFGGARLRTPFEPMLMVLAAGAVPGGWRRPSGPAIAMAVAAAALAGLAVIPQVPRSLAAWPDYGLEWPSIFKRDNGILDANGGMNVPAFDGTAQFSVSPAGFAPVVVRVGTGRGIIQTETIVPGETRVIRIFWPPRGLAYIEVEASTLEGQPARIRVQKAS